MIRAVSQPSGMEVPPPMELPTVEQLLHKARALAVSQGAGARQQVMNLLTTAVEAIPVLDTFSEAFDATVAAADILGSVGALRRRSLLLWQAATLASSPQGRKAALPAARLHAALQPLACGSSLPAAASPAAARGWEVVQLCLLQAAMATALAAGALGQAWHATSQLLREHHSQLAASHQAHLMDSLLSIATKMGPEDLGAAGFAGPGPTLQLARLLPLPPHAQPVPLMLLQDPAARRPGDHRSGSAAGQQPSSSTGGDEGRNNDPFLYNPYEENRRRTGGKKAPGGAAAANSDGALVMRCATGEPLYVEVLLANPLAVPVVIDELALHLLVAPSMGEAAPAATDDATTPAATADNAAAAAFAQRDAGSEQQGLGQSGEAGPRAAALAPQPAGTPQVSAALPGPSQPSPAEWQCAPLLGVEVAPGQQRAVLLSATALEAATARVAGCLVSMWGRQWAQPFIALPAAGPRAPGRGALPPPLQRLPVLQALPGLTTLHAQLTGPGAPLQTLPTPPTGSRPPEPADSVSTNAAPVPAIHVFEGQQLTWKLTLTNAGKTSITHCGIGVSEEGSHAGTVERRVTTGRAGLQDRANTNTSSGTAPETAWRQAAGRDVELAVLSEVSQALPLACGQTATVQLHVRVGSLSGRASVEQALRLCVQHGNSSSSSATANMAAAARPPGLADGTLWGRALTTPLQFVVKPAIKLTAVEYRHVSLPAERQPSGHFCTRADCVMQLHLLNMTGLVITACLVQASAAAEATEERHAANGQSSSGSAAAEHGGAGWRPMELQPGSSGVLTCSLSDVRALLPGGRTVLSSGSAAPQELLRWCAQQVCGALMVQWHAWGEGPCGRCSLPCDIVAASLAPEAAAHLLPGTVRFTLLAAAAGAQPADMGAAAAGGAVEGAAEQAGGVPSLHGVQLAAGAEMQLQVAVQSTWPEPLQGALSLRVARLPHGEPSAPHDARPRDSAATAAAQEPDAESPALLSPAPGVLISGCTEHAALDIPAAAAGSSAPCCTYRALFLQPGLYTFNVHASLGPKSTSASDGAAGSQVASAWQRQQYGPGPRILVDQLLVLCLDTNTD